VIRPFRGVLPRLGERSWVDDSAQVIGDVELGDDASIWPLAAVRGDVNRIRIGRGSNVQDCCVLHVTHDGPYSPGGAGLEIGEDVTIGHSAVLHACRIGNRVLIGMGSLVLDKAVIEDEVLLAAGSLVPSGKRLVSGFLYRGRPAGQARPLTDSERAWLLYSAQHYVRLKDQYQLDLSRPVG